MTEPTTTKPNDKKTNAIDRIGNTLENRQSRSLFLLIITSIIILALNALLPTLQGGSHYTVEPVSMTYGEYQEALEDDPALFLTPLSTLQMAAYVVEYITEHPELTDAEKFLVRPPEVFPVTVYTKYFFEQVLWWISSGVSILSATLLFYMLFNFLITRKRTDHPRYVQLVLEVDGLVDKSLDPITFEPWMDNIFNYMRKIQQHIRNTKAAIQRLETRTNFRVRLTLRDYFTDPEKDTLPDKVLLRKYGVRWWNFRYIKYANRKNKLLSYLDPQYIHDYVVDGYVPHFRYIYPSYVANGTNHNGVVTDSYTSLPSDAERIRSDALAKVVATIALTLLFAILITVTVVTSYEQEPLWIILNALTKLAPLGLQVIFAIDYANSYMDTQVIPTMTNRRSIALLYLADSTRPDFKKYVATPGGTDAKTY